MIENYEAAKQKREGLVCCDGHDATHKCSYTEEIELKKCETGLGTILTCYFSVTGWRVGGWGKELRPYPCKLFKGDECGRD